jgi:hypothetical protein
VAEVWGALAQVIPAATTLTDAYTCPANYNATVEVVMCNRSTASPVRISHASNGEANASKQYLLFDYVLNANDAKTTARFTVAGGDVVRVYSASGNVAFNVNGLEESV